MWFSNYSSLKLDQLKQGISADSGQQLELNESSCSDHTVIFVFQHKRAAPTIKGCCVQ
jgi:hypothetical protein